MKSGFSDVSTMTREFAATSLTNNTRESAPQRPISYHNTYSQLMMDLYKRDDEDNTSLHWVIIVELVDVAIAIIKKTHPPHLLDLRNDLRQTPLVLAALTRQSSVVNALLEAGADLTLVDRHGDSFLHIASKQGDMNTLMGAFRFVGKDVLLPVINRQNNDGLCPVHLAVIGGHTHVLSFLYEMGADMNIRDGKIGYTPLHHGIRQHGDMGISAVIACLVERAKVDLLVSDYNGHTPFMLAIGYRRFDTVVYLATRGPGREHLHR